MVSAFWEKSTCVLEENNTLLKVGCVILCVMFRSLATTVYMFQMCFLTDKKEMLNIFNIISSFFIHFIHFQFKNRTKNEKLSCRLYEFQKGHDGMIHLTTFLEELGINLGWFVSILVAPLDCRRRIYS